MSSRYILYYASNHITQIMEHFEKLLADKEAEILLLKRKIQELERKNMSRSDLKQMYLSHSRNICNLIANRLKTEDFDSDYILIKIPESNFNTEYTFRQREKKRAHLKRLQQATEDLISMVQKMEVREVTMINPIDGTNKTINTILEEIEKTAPKKNSKALQTINDLMVELNAV